MIKGEGGGALSPWVIVVEVMEGVEGQHHVPLGLPVAALLSAHCYVLDVSISITKVPQ